MSIFRTKIFMTYLISLQCAEKETFTSFSTIFKAIGLATFQPKNINFDNMARFRQNNRAQ